MRGKRPDVRWPKRRRRASPGRCAMTLLEITVVLVIVSILMAVVIPNFGPLRLRGQLRTSTRNLAALIRYARGEAIYGHRVVKLRLDVENHRYRLDLMIDSIPANKRDESERYLVEAVRDLPDRVYFDRVVLYRTQNSNRPGDDIVVLDFTHRGSATPASIVLADTKGRHMTIDVFGTTGAVEVYHGEPPDVEGEQE